MWCKNMESGSIAFSDGSSCGYEIKVSRRSTMAIQVTKEGQILVKLPYYASMEEGHRFAVANKDWIYRQLCKIKSKLREKQEFHWSDGADVFLYGKSMSLHVKIDAGKKGFSIAASKEEITVKGPFHETWGQESETEIKNAMKLWYRKEARACLEEKTAWWASRMMVTYEKIAIRDQATRWGSCSTKGNLNFNWRLVLLPAELADYVVVHELAHRLHMNHSRQFWNVVGSVMPDYRERRKALKHWGEKLDLIY